MEIGVFPRQVPVDMAASSDAVLVIQSMGKGRVVLCDIPLGDWTTDPRSQIFMSNAIDYLLSLRQSIPKIDERFEARGFQPQSAQGGAKRFRSVKIKASMGKI